MDTHHRHPRYYQGRSLGYYSSQYQQPHVQDRGWSPWQSPSVAVQYRRSSGRPWGTVLLAAAAFLIILAVVIIAGLAIYMGALKLEVSQYLVLDGSFRVVSGDSYNSSLLDHTSNLFQRKAQIYRLMIESILRKSDLSPAIKQSSILGFTNGSLVVFFRLILDRRKIPKKQIILEERIKSIILNGVSTSSPVKNFRIDKSQVFIKRVADELSNSHFEEGEIQNQTVEIHNGLLRKSPPQVVTAHYTSSSSNQSNVQKASTKNYGLVEGSFKLSSPKPIITREQTTMAPTVFKTSPFGIDLKSVKSNTSSKNTSKTDSSTIDFFQHSPALNAFLNQKLKAEKVSNTTLHTEPTEPIINYGEANLITLLPYTFHNENEPWIPMLPENFTRYPERRPYDHVTEDYSTEGIGVVEVVIDPDDLKSSLPYKLDWPEVSSRNNDRSNFTNHYYSSQNMHPGKKNTQDGAFVPTKDSQLSYLLNTQVGRQGQTSEKNSGNKIFEEIFSNERRYSDVSPREGESLPEFPIIQEFHKLDALLRSYNVDDKATELPVTLLPARSNVNMKQQIRPKPFQKDGVGSSMTMEFGESKPRANTQSIEQKVVSFHVVPVDFSEKSEKSDEINDQYFQISLTNKSDNVFGAAGKKILELKAPIFQDVPENESNRNHNQAENIEDLIMTPTTGSVTINFDENPITEETNDFDSITTLEPYPASSSRENRFLNMARISNSEKLPFKVVLQKSGEGRSSSNEPFTNANKNNSDSKNSNLFVVKLKDTKMQEVLEKIMYNLTSEGSLNSFDLEEDVSPHTTSDDNTKDDVDSIAHNRKYDNSLSDSKNGLSSNSSVKNDFIWYYLKHTKNESLDHMKYNESSNIYVKGNLEKEEKVTKGPPKYVVNKNGFLMLTKLYNKIPSNMLNKEVQEKSNFTKNHTSECLGSMTIKCDSGECVSTLSRCNNLVDCSDGSDEKNCTCAEFLRAQYLTRKICDGVVDCWDFSDENSCDWCKSGQYVCTNSRVCIDQGQVCNGVSDCPNGDDEKNCISIAPHMTQTDNVKYFSSGTLMIRKEGQWGKLCTQNFDSLSAIFKSKWTLEDLGKVVCKTMTFRNFDSIEHINDTDDDSVTSNSFYELLYSKEAALRQSPRFGLTFENTNCTEKKVVRITCSTLDCGVRPKANPQWGRTKRLTGSRRSRIVGGGNAGPGAWPWLAALYKEGEFQCGATLISDKWLISAGHCFYHSQDDYWVARLGALRRGTNLPSPYEQLRVVSRILLHPNYVDSGFINDISLLEMEEPVSFTNYVRPICLPQPSTVLRDGKMCTVIGWGQLFEIGRIFPDTLQEVQLPLISTAECRKRTLFLPLYKVTENMFCAGYDRGGRDACLGDSGGPLMCQEQDGRWSLMGVTSNGYGCARANRPGVYTKVANYISWVHSSIAADSVRSQSAGRNISCHGHRCPLGECLPPARICNGFMECSDGSDEKNCW